MMRIYCLTFLLCCFVVPLQVQVQAEEEPKIQLEIIGPVCDPITGCPAAISQTTYHGMDAYWLSDSKTQALVVPALGRVMNYAFLNGENWLWNADLANGNPPEHMGWKNWGGDKTWLAPQSEWPQLAGRNWPPDEAWDGLTFEAEVLTGGILRTISEVSPVSGVRVMRDYWHDEKTGEFVIQQSVEKVKGAPLKLSIWSVTQIVPPDAVFVPLNPQSDYKDNFHWISKKGEVAWNASPSMLQLHPAPESAYKVGADSPVAALAAVKDGMAFVQKTARPDGVYPDGAEGEGFPVEVYNTGIKSLPYMEMELLSPLRDYPVGARWIHTMRWSLHRLPLHDVDSQAVQDEVERLLTQSTQGQAGS